MKTTHISSKQIVRKHHTIDASNQILGRLASDAAGLLIGKHKVNYSPHLDMGDFVEIANASEVKVTGKKEEQKVYYKHSGYPGGLKEVSYSKLKEEQPEKIIEHAVKGMLPKNRLQSKRMARLKVTK